MSPILTVFTTTYNRAHTLARTYESLKSQSCKDFVWLIIDDGSTDNTAELVKQWQQNEKSFRICYIYKENGGMHTAHNVAYESIDTELNICIDSDDCLAKEAVAKISKKWASVKDKGYAGIIGLDAYFDGKITGARFPDNLTETTLGGYYASGGKGDKKMVYRTDVIKNYPKYPTFGDEKYFSLSFKYRLIDKDFKLAVLNEVLCNVEYQADGSSSNMWRQYAENPKGFTEWRKFCITHPITKKRRVIDNIHYISNSLLAKNKNIITASPTPLLSFFVFPLGVLLYFITIFQAKRH